MKISIIGAGVQGSAIASVLARVTEVTEIVCADANLARVNRIRKKLNDKRVTSCQTDASNPSVLLNTTRGSDVVINATLPRFNLAVMNASLIAGAHYVDLASDDPLNQLTLSSKWEKAGLSAVITQGGPFVINALVKSAAESLDEVNEINLRHGWKRLGEDDRPKCVWYPTWSPEVALSEWENKPIIYSNGTYERRAVFSGLEEYRFPDPLGSLKICNVDYEPVYTLPKFIDKGLRCVDCKIPPDYIAGSLIEMGFASREPLDVKGVKVIPRDILMALVPQPADLKANSVRYSDVLTCYSAQIKGEKNGPLIHTVYRSSSSSESLKTYGVEWGDVSVPVVITALMLANDELKPGVVAPEDLPSTFLKKMSEWGMTFQHTVTRL